MGFILFIVAKFLQAILFPFFIVYAILKRRNLKSISQYYHNFAFSLDQLGNVVGGDLMNDLLLKKDPAKLYGNPDETISHVTGVNKLAGKLTPVGDFVAKTLNKIDPNHVEKASQNEQ